MRAVLLLGLALGCPGNKAPTQGSLTLADETETREGFPEVPPGTWSEPGGLSLRIPEGWHGHAGTPGQSLLLAVTHETLGTRLELWAFARGDAIGPRERQGCIPVFEDAAAHRAVPAIAPALSATCVHEDPRQPVVQGWYGVIGDREIHVELVHPAGRVVQGRLEAERLLLGLTSRGTTAAQDAGQ